MDTTIEASGALVYKVAMMMRSGLRDARMDEANKARAH